MKCICVTGATQPDLELVFDILQRAGMNLPKPASRGDLIDISSWHQQALTMDIEDVEADQATTNPGRFMEQLASDIFVANIKSDAWGWADTRSTWLLDFWVNFDPRLYFVLVYVSPQQMLANAMSSQMEIDSVAAVIDAWQVHYQQLLRFHLRNQQRSLLVDARECAKNADALIERCAKDWKLPLIAQTQTIQRPAANESLALYLAHQLCKDYSKATDLQHELTATITRLGDTEQIVNNELSAEHIIADYRVLLDRSAELDLLAATHSELNDLKVQFDETVANHAQQQNNAEDRIKEVNQQNERLLTNSNQVQEQLKGYILKHESQQKLNATLQDKIATLIQASDDQSKLADERQAYFDQLSKKHEEVFSSQAQQLKDTVIRLTEASQENELLLLQLHQVQEELEVYFLKHESLQVQNDVLQVATTTLTQTHDVQANLAIDRQLRIDALTLELGSHAIQAQHRQTQIEALSQTNSALVQEKSALVEYGDALAKEVLVLTQERDELTQRLKEVNQQNERLLTNSNQVQEQLKGYILKHESQQKLNATLQDKIATLIQASDDQSKLADERQAYFDQLSKKHEEVFSSQAQQLKDTVIRLTEASQENELLLLQLHQVQEELEVYFLKHESLQVQNDVLQVATTTLTQAHDVQANLAIDRQLRIDALTLELGSHATQAQHRQTQIEALSQTNSALVQEKSALVEYGDALAKEVLVLIQERDQLTQHLTDWRVKADQLTQKHDETLSSHIQQNKAIETQLKLAEQESELLLLQLHQVQEELEHYFLQYQDKQKQLQHAENRWQRMLQGNPDYCDVESIVVLPVEGDEGSTMVWQLKNLNVVGRSFPELKFKTNLEQGIAEIVFVRETDDPAPFIRWPINLANQNELKFSFIGSDATIQERIATLLDFATSDWDLLQTLVRLLERTLQQPAIHNIPTGLDLEPLRIGLSNLREVIEIFPATLRYDLVALKRKRVNPDYEHLWIRFDNLAFNNKRWPEFEFRLACANVRPNHFGSHPKLEFPEEFGQAPFEAWFIEAYDDLGAKLELRFALPDAMDLAVWQRLSENDHAFLSALIQRLPVILDTLQSANVQLQRPWQDWVNLAQEIERVLTIRTIPTITESQAITDLELPTSAVTTLAPPTKSKAAPTGKTGKSK